MMATSGYLRVVADDDDAVVRLFLHFLQEPVHEL